MLKPAGIVEVNAVSGFVVLMFERGKELVHAVLFGPVAVHPGERGHDDYDRDGGRDLDLAPPGFCGVVGLGVEQGHRSRLSITDSRMVKVGG